MSDPAEQSSSVYDVAIRSPLERAARLSAAHGNTIYLKREDMQAVHSFKIRGAYNKIARLTADERRRGIIAASAGNHAQGVAYSARKLDISAVIVMPRTTPAIKVDAVRSFGAEIILEGDNYTEAYEACQKLLQDSGRIFIHPFDDPDVIAGQGTVGLEIMEQASQADYIFVPVGGGGLIAGIAQVVKKQFPHVRIIGVEPEDSNAMQASLDAGELVTLPHVGVFADGVAVKYVGRHTFDLCRRYVDEVLTVTNDQICAAIKSIFEDTRSIVEPAGALSVAGAVLYAENHGLRERHIVTICSGANMAFEKLQFIAERTLLGSGREALFEIVLPEQPGALARLCADAINGHNITQFSYRLADRTQARILVGISITGDEDKQRFVNTLSKHHYAYFDLSSDDTAKEHVRHMVGGASETAGQETLFEINFPERPRALNEFLAAIGDTYNISLFHYRGQGGDTGKVLIGFESHDLVVLQQMLTAGGYEFRLVDSPAARHFLQQANA